jgi:hypothetical protein
MLSVNVTKNAIQNSRSRKLVCLFLNVLFDMICNRENKVHRWIVHNHQILCTVVQYNSVFDCGDYIAISVVTTAK